MNFVNELSLKTEIINAYLTGCIGKYTDSGQDVIAEAAKYSLLAGGKRIRPVVALAACEMLGGDTSVLLPFACAVECIHTYSLIHDDLPCMDNDNLRRGKPTCHIRYGEANALLAGDALLTLAFSLAASSDANPTDAVKAVSLIAEASGVNGMIGGQGIDIAGTDSLPSLLNMYNLKTARLLSLSGQLGVVFSSNSKVDFDNIETFLYNLGVAFQIKDDLLDVLGNTDKLGKNIGSDELAEKNTAVSYLGIEGAKIMLSEYTEKAKLALNSYGGKGRFLLELSEMLLNRDK